MHPIHHHAHHHHFFENKELDALYFTSALTNFGQSLVSIFIPIYFWTLGFPLWQIMLFYLIRSGYFLIFSFGLVPLIRHLSNKMLMFLSAPFILLYYFGLEQITSCPALFYILPGLVALNMLFYNVGYHLEFTGAADGDKMGRELGLRRSINMLVKFAAPALGGMFIFMFGFGSMFFVASSILLLALIPLLFFSRHRVDKKLRLGTVAGYLFHKKLINFNLADMGYGVESNVVLILWSIFVYITVGNIEDFGEIVSLGLLLGALTNYLVGYFADKGQRRKILSLSTWLYAVVWVIKSVVSKTWLVVSVHVFNNVAESVMITSLLSHTYKITRFIKHPASFILSREILYHFSRLIMLPIFILLSLHLPEQVFFTTAFLLTGLISLLYLRANRAHTSNIIR